MAKNILESFEVSAKMQPQNVVQFEIQQPAYVNDKVFLECLRKVSKEMPSVGIQKNDVPWADISVETEADFVKVCDKMRKYLSCVESLKSENDQ